MNLTTIPTADLVAELSRRREAERKASAPPEVFFYGVWPGTRAGHYFRAREGWQGNVVREAENRIGKRMAAAGRRGWLYPWDPGDYQANRGRPQEQGLFHYWHAPGVTAISCWDRSEDTRGNCCTAFVAEADLAYEELLDLAQTIYPAVFERMKAAGIVVGCA